MKLWDVHTHRLSKVGINNCSPLNFNPKPNLFYSVGIHPWKAELVTDEEWDSLFISAKHPQILAIGEVGLDKRKGGDLNIQLEVFNKQVELAEKLEKPLIIHMVHSSNEIIKLRKDLKTKVPWIIHGFRGNPSIAEQLINHGFYLSFGEKYSKKSLQLTPLKNMFIETDESKVDICDIYHQISNDLQVSYDQLSDQIQQNFNNVFFRQ